MSIVSGSILIVDDEDNLRTTLTRILIGAGWKVTGAANGSDALNLVSQNHFDLVYLDLRLPDMHGIDILRELRRLDNKLPVILLTAYGTMNSAVESLHLGASDYLLKPVEPEQLINRTKKVLFEQQKERRRKELQDQIALLQAELADLENDNSAGPLMQTGLVESSRYLVRGPFTVDLQARKVDFKNYPLELPPATYEYFLVLTRHAPEIVKYQTLVTEAQGYPVDYSEARELAKWHIHVIRQLIEPNPRNPKFLLNARGLGYQLNVD